MKLVVVGVNHKDTPLEIREQGAFIQRTINEGIGYLLGQPKIKEVVILSTCNRSEIYVASSDSEAAVAILKNFYCQKKSQALGPYLFEKKDRQALAHLYHVVTGLNSMILGEDQILGQVRQALEGAQAIKGCGKYLTKIFREAITFTKKVKTKYKISETPLSLSSTAVKHIKRQFPNDYDQKKILIIGSGKMGILALRYMKAEGFQNPYMTNRSYHHMDKCQTVHENVKRIYYEDRYDYLESMDVVISATASPHIILKADKIKNREKGLMIIDLALPRDIEPQVGNLPLVELLTIDHFNEIMDESMAYRLEIAKQIAYEIDSEIDGLLAWITHAKVDNMVKELHQSSLHLAEETIENLLENLDLSEKEEKYLTKIIYSKFRKMVMPPIKQLKKLENEEAICGMEKTVTYLFAPQFEKVQGKMQQGDQ